MCLMLAGLRGVDQEIWKAARIDGIPMWKTYVFIVIPIMRPVFITTLVIIASGIVRVYDLVVAQTGGGPGIASEVPAKYVYDFMFLNQNLGQGFAASTMMLITVIIIIVPWAYLEFGGRSVSNPGTLATAIVGSDPTPMERTGARGPKPRRSFSRRNIFIYGTLLVVAVYYLLPLYVMITTSLKGMPEIRVGSIFAMPLEITFEPWVKAWAEACTGLNCDGLSRGFWNSVRITVPSVILSIAVASVNGYALANWRFKGANTFFTILIVGAFIPYQVMIYPIVIVLREIGIYGTLWGLILVHTIFGMPILTLLFRNYFTSVPEELFKAAAGRRRRILGHLLQGDDADEPADLRRRHHSPGHRNLERLPVRRDLHEARYLPDDGATQQHRQLSPRR